MQSDLQTKLHRIQRISGMLRGLCKGLIALFGLLFLAEMVFLLFAHDGTLRSFDVSFPVNELSFRGRLVVLAMSALTTAVIIGGFHQLYRLFDGYSRGEIFTGESVAQLRRFAITCMTWGGVNVLWSMLPLALLAHRPHAIVINSDAIPLGIILFVVVWFMEMAVEMREENELTI